MCSHKFRKKSKQFVPRDKNDQICTTALYIHGYILWFSYAFKVCSKSVFEIWYIHPAIVVGAVIMHKMFDTGTKHLLATDGQLKVFLGPCGWRNSVFKSPSCTFTSVTMPTHQNVSQMQLTYKKHLMFFISISLVNDLLKCYPNLKSSYEEGTWQKLSTF